MGTHTAIAVGLALYAVFMLAVSLFWMLRVRKAADYLVGGRNLPFWALTGNITATCIGTGVIIGASGLAYQHGWAGSAYPVGLGLGTLVAGLFFAKMRRYRFMTLSEEITAYYGGNRIVAEFANISLFLSQLCWLTVQIMGGASILAAVTRFPPEWCVIASGLITASVAIPGGFKSVVYTDFFQAIILLVGFAAATHSALHHSGGMTGLRLAAPAAYFSFLGTKSYGGWKVSGLLFALAISVMADPSRRMSMYGARSERGARWAMVVAGAIVIGFSVVVGITGMYAFRLNPHLAVPDSALLWLVINVLPAWLAALVVVAVASGIFSCANGNAMAASSFFVRHIFHLAVGRHPRYPMLVARVALAGIFILCTAMALHAGTIVGFVVKFLPVTVSGLAIIVVMGRFWRRATWQGALAALIATPAMSLAALWLFPAGTDSWGTVFIPVAVGALVHFLVSALTPRSARTFEEVAQDLAGERLNIDGPAPEAAVAPARQTAPAT